MWSPRGENLAREVHREGRRRGGDRGARAILPGAYRRLSAHMRGATETVSGITDDLDRQRLPSGRTVTMRVTFA